MWMNATTEYAKDTSRTQSSAVLKKLCFFMYRSIHGAVIHFEVLLKIVKKRTLKKAPYFFLGFVLKFS